MEINIDTNLAKIFKQYLAILNTVLRTKKMTNLELEVLSKLLLVNYKYSHIEKSQRDKILFHKNTKQRIRESIGNLSKHSYNNIITSLRKKGVISKKELLISAPLNNNEIVLTFKLKINPNKA